MKEIYIGTVVWFNNRDGFGFITWNHNQIAQKDMFVHFSDIEMDGFRSLKKDQQVAFSIGTNHQGDPKAIHVQIIEATG